MGKSRQCASRSDQQDAHSPDATSQQHEAKVRRWTKITIIGRAGVTSYEDLQKARTKLSAKEAEKEARKSEKLAVRVKGSSAKSKTGAAEAGRTQDGQCEHHVGTQGPEAQSCGGEIQRWRDHATTMESSRSESVVIGDMWRRAIASATWALTSLQAYITSASPIVSTSSRR
jgi:hypothetical protein